MAEYIIDQNTYADEESQRLLAENKAFDAKNTLDPVLLCPLYAGIPVALDSGKPLGIFGEAGTCKTSSVIKYGVSRGIPVCIIPCSKGTMQNILLGKKTFDENNNVKFVMGLLLKGLTKGWITVLDDGTNLSQAILTECQEPFMMNPTFTCLANDNTVYNIHPNARLVMTGNPGYAGTEKIPEALQDRIVNQIYVCHEYNGEIREGLSPQGFLMFAKNHWPWVTDAFVDAIYKLNWAIKECADKNAKKFVPCGTRQLIGLMGDLLTKDSVFQRDDFDIFLNMTYFSVLRRANIRIDVYSQFVSDSNIPVSGIVDTIYNEYVNSPRPKKIGQSQPQPQPQTTPNKPAPQPNSGTPFITDLKNERDIRIP